MLQLRCIVCHRPFDFAQHETAVVLRHIAYGYDFVDAQHEATALTWFFVDPQFDRPEFSHDWRRASILDVAPPDGWSAVVPQPPERAAVGDLLSFQPLGLWVLVENHDGSRYVEGLLRDLYWESEPGGAEFAEGANGPGDAVGYAPVNCRADPSRVALWESIIYARRRGGQVPPCRDLPELKFHDRELTREVVRA
jgi:hypothetical protein